MTLTKIPSNEIAVDWASDDEMLDFVLYSPIAKVAVISGDLLASFKDSSVPLVWENSEFEITLTPAQAWNIAIDQMGQWNNGSETIWIRSDYWDEGEIIRITPLGEQVLNELTGKNTP